MGFIDKLVENPWTFHYLRKVPELNYGATKGRLRKYLPGTGLTVDLGCGTGEFSHLFAPNQYIGVDVSQPYLAFAKGRHPDRLFMRAWGQSLALATGCCEQVLINGVLHHLPEDIARGLLAEARRILIPEGRLVLIEDIQPPPDALLTRLIHAMDAGDHIRPVGHYPGLAGDAFRLDHHETYRSGACHYGLWILTPQ